MSNRSNELIERVEKYTKENLLWNSNSDIIKYSKIIDFNISNVVPTISGPKPQEKIELNNSKQKIEKIIVDDFKDL